MSRRLGRSACTRSNTSCCTMQLRNDKPEATEDAAHLHAPVRTPQHPEAQDRVESVTLLRLEVFQVLP